jgi:uncharacterized membrane protein
MSILGRILRNRVVCAALLSGASLFSTTADAASCTAGSLCLWDDATPGAVGRFSGTNSSWKPYGWYHRSDRQYNNGTSGMNACIYHGTNYSGGGYAPFLLPRGWTGGGKNFGGSNKWTFASKCP